MEKLIDRLYHNVATKGNVCLGLDTDLSYLPEKLLATYSNRMDALFAFNKGIIDATLDAVAVYKVQIAYYEALGLAGLGVYARTLTYLRNRGALIIADVKRGDIAKTAEMYAQAHFSGDFEADFITVNPFMGMDTLEPYAPFLENHDKGLFVLVATSNPGASDIEGILAADGESVSEKTGRMVQTVGDRFLGECGYSAIGAVVGCTNHEQTVSIREKLPRSFFLIPGYGAQGGTAEDMKDYLRDGNGGIVNSSRGILLAYRNQKYQGMDFIEAARAESLHMRDEILAATGDQIVEVL
jgi:orotidine-5'-phosphate decarboxylase